MPNKMLKTAAALLSLVMALLSTGPAFAGIPISIPTLNMGVVPGAKGLPCPLGTSLTMVKIGVFVCMGVPVADPCGATIDSYAPPCKSGGGLGAASALGGGAQGAEVSSGTGGQQQTQQPPASNVSGAKAVMRLLSCDEYSAMSPMVNPQNEQPDPENQWAFGDGLVQNGWWAQKMSYPDSASGQMREGYGGAVVSYVETDMGGGRIERQKPQILAVGQCQRRIEVPKKEKSSCVNEDGSFPNASCARSYISNTDSF